MRSDLAAECLREGALPPGVFSTRREVEGGAFTVVEISTESGAKAVGKPRGLYCTLDCGPLWQEQERAPLTEALAQAIGALLPKEGGVLVVGLGNRELTPDGLGPQTAEKIFVTRGLPEEVLGQLPPLRQVWALSPNVLGKTGLEAAETVAALVEATKPAAVLAVDALASGSLERLGSTIQLSNAGIVPGSGVLNSRRGLSEESLGVPVLALGIPTVVDLGNLLAEPLAQPLFTTPRQVDLLIQRGAELLSGAINRALHPALSLEELLLLQS